MSETQEIETTSTPAPAPATSSNQTKVPYSPNSSYLVNMLDKIEHFIVGAKEVEDKIKQISEKIGDVTKMSTDKLTEAINRLDPADTATKALLEKYKKMREDFDVMEMQILKEASKMLGFEQRDYLIKPLKDLMDELKEGRLTADSAIKNFEKLLRTVGINKAIIYTQMIPYVGEIIYAALNNLDNFAATQAIIKRFLNLLKLLGVPEEKLGFLKTYAEESYFTRKYDGFRSWLADGAELGEISIPIYYFRFYPFSTFGHTFDGLRKDALNFFNDPRTLKPEDREPTAYGGGVGGGGGDSAGDVVDNWISVKDIKRKQNKKTRRSIHTINKSIKTHLSRLRRTRRKPLRKSVAAFHVKGGF
jgi:hypothetical protein